MKFFVKCLAHTLVCIVRIRCSPPCFSRDWSFLLSFSALMWKMALPQVGARWTPRPALPLGWSFTPPSLGTASAESPFSTDQTATMTCHQRRCRETLHFQASSKYQQCLASSLTFTSSLTLSQQAQTTSLPLSSQGGGRREMNRAEVAVMTILRPLMLYS